MRRIGCCAIVVLLFAVGCRQAPPAKTGPSAPAPKSQPAGPTSTPATQPASQPVQEVAKPPADPLHPRVRITQLSDPQVGFVHVDAMAEGASESTVKGDWIRPNKIDIETDEVAQLTIDLSDLPLKAGKRIVLHLDRQGFDLASDIGPRVTFERGRAGVWERVRDE